MKLLSLRSFAALLALCALPLLAACPADEEENEPATDAGQVAPDAGQVTPDAGQTPDAGESADAGTTPDAGTPVEPGPGELGGACATGDTCTAGECVELPNGSGKRCTVGCFDNSECPENLRCEVTSYETMHCLFGPRGTGGIGDPCGENKGLGCASGNCVDADPTKDIPVDTCTASCEGDDDCALPFPVCTFGVYLCLPVVSGDTGGRCRSSGDCYPDTGATCTDLAGIGERCTKTCTTAADCGADYLECKDINGTNYCVLKSNG